jgi:hypothetical protein
MDIGMMTDEGTKRLLNAIKYGVCEKCGAARELEKGVNGWPALKVRDNEAYVQLVCSDPNCDSSA